MEIVAFFLLCFFVYTVDKIQNLFICSGTGTHDAMYITVAYIVSRKVKCTYSHELVFDHILNLFNGCCSAEFAALELYKFRDFLNLCVLYRLPRQGTPEGHATEILRTVKAVEKALGRPQEEELFDEEGRRVYHNRCIDIDILCYGTHLINTEELTIPHPLIAQRDFVRKPLLEISKPAIREAFPEFFA